MLALSPDPAIAVKDVRVFPNLIPDEVIKFMPVAIIITTEFDPCRKHAEEAAELYRRNGRLYAYGCIKGKPKLKQKYFEGGNKICQISQRTFL